MTLSKEQNASLTEVGPNTPMGELMRKYWHPIGASSELDKKPTKKIRILGEDLVLYRDKGGQLGLISERCPHRGVSLAFGYCEDKGIRCPYHGWLFDETGGCIEQPNEPANSNFKNRLKITSYPVKEMGGLIFAYLGDDPVPLLPPYDLFLKENVIRTIGYAIIPCNFMQIMENSFDPVHFEWLHGRYFEYVMERDGTTTDADLEYTKGNSGKHVDIKFDRFDYGIVKRRLLEGQSKTGDDWSTGHPVIFPNILRVGRGFHHSFQIRVPMDDTHTYHIWYNTYVPDEGVQVPKDYPITLFEVPFMKENGEFRDDFVAGQDIMCWISQGNISNREIEHLGTTDKGIIVYRQLMMEQLEKVRSGDEPMCVFREAMNEPYIEFHQEKDKLDAGNKLHKLGILKQQSKFAPNIEEIYDLLEGKVTN